MVDVGYQLAASVSNGDASVPVVFVNALGTAQDQWDQVLPRLYRQTTVTYDRPGIGMSDPLPSHLAGQPRTFGALADELRGVLDKLGIESPHVVVGHSLGALIAMVYAARYGACTAGLVLVDGTTLEHLKGGSWPTYEGVRIIRGRRGWISRDRSLSWMGRSGCRCPLRCWRARSGGGHG